MEANSLYGRPWTDVARFNSFDEADKKRKQLSEDKEVQVKVKKSESGFTVKVRSALVEANVEQKSDKSSKNQRKK
jgi:uncharacterized Fe-S center protein